MSASIPSMRYPSGVHNATVLAEAIAGPPITVTSRGARGTAGLFVGVFAFAPDFVLQR